MNSCWIPEKCFYDSNTEWVEYEDFLHTIFKQDFITNKTQYNSKNVNIRFHPIECGKEEAFYHVTCKDYNGEGVRQPDFRRCERIRWVKAFIDNCDSCNTNICIDCNGLKIWKEPYKNNFRIYFFLEEERYVVIIEQRQTYNLLITAYYIDYDNALKKLLKKFNNSKNT